MEERLIERPVNTNNFDFLNDNHLNDHKSEKVVLNSMNDEKYYKDSSPGHINQIKQNTDWLKLLHRQEVAHQLELEKWHAILGAATDLLRKVHVVSKIMDVYGKKHQTQEIYKYLFFKFFRQKNH